MTRRRAQLLAGSAIYLLCIVTLALLYHRTLYGAFWLAVQIAARRIG